METPLVERLTDALNDARAATEQFDRVGLSVTDPSKAAVWEVAEVCEAGISLGLAVQKLIAILCEEAPEPQED